jgi:carboxyl-terminal processing protease
MVTLSVTQSRNGPPTHIPIKVTLIRPNEMTDASIAASAKVFTINNDKIGYLHLWTYSTPDVQEVVQNLLSSTAMQNVDGLILDMRCRHGGAPPDAAETFVGITPELDMADRSSRHIANFRYRKPLVGLIDGGTRSGMEVLAYSLKKAGIVLVGTRTAGAFLGGSPFILKDGSLLYLAVMSALVDGHPLEGVGVSPDLNVAYSKQYSHGHDPQLQAALLQMQKTLQGRASASRKP